MNLLFKEKLESTLKEDERLISDDGRILKNKAVELANKLDDSLISSLGADKDLNKLFFKKITDLTVFDKDLFIEFVSNKEFLPDSYTAFKNKIGLAVDRNYLKQDKEVTLVWPYKDCVLEGGQTKEEAKRSEVFWNTTLAPEEINRLLEPKVLTNWKRYDKDSSKKGRKVNEIFNKDNLVIKGNNLLALQSLKKQYGGKVKLIYIDPPFNTGKDSFRYNDSFNHSTWLTFMRNRLEVAKQLLSEDGSIYVHLDQNESHYCKVLMDEIFGVENFRNEIIWAYQGAGQSEKQFKRKHDNILFYSKSENNLFNWEAVGEKIGEKQRVKYTGKDEKGFYKSYKHKDGKVFKKYFDENEIMPRLDYWTDISIIQSKEERLDLMGQKPEALLYRIIQASTNEGDIVLDYHAGTGTTGAVAHKIKRQYILIEQLDYIHDLPEARLNGVIAGDQSGISKIVNWKGGGSFVYTELMPLNEKFVREIEAAKSEKEVVKIWEAIQKNGFVSYRVDPKKFDENAKEFADLDLANQKKFVLESLDANMLYVNYSDIGDKEYAVSANDKKLNNEFYGNASSRV